MVFYIFKSALKYPFICPLTFLFFSARESFEFLNSETIGEGQLQLLRSIWTFFFRGFQSLLNPLDLSGA